MSAMRRGVGERASTVCVVGAGYVGVPTAAGLARFGHHVVCADVDADRIGRLERGEVDIHEEGLEELVRAGLSSGHLKFVLGAGAGVARAEFVMLCVQTPQRDDGAADLSAIESVVQEVAPLLCPDAIVVSKSTLPVGSATFVQDLLRRSGAPDGIAVASNPEFLREGSAVEDFLHPHRIIVGADDDDVATRVASLYDGFDAPVVITRLASAEMIKYASNAFLATKISFVNELANACEALGADINEVISGVGHDPRIGFGWLTPGPGWGGSCFPKDTAALLHATSEAGYEFELVRSAVEVNRRQRERVIEKVQRAHGGSLNQARIALWGLAFKAGTDDLRESPAVDVARRLLDAGASVRAFDPAVPASAATTRLPGLEVAVDAYGACADADVLVVMTEWEELRCVDLRRVAELMATPSIVDARNLLDSGCAQALGFAYEGVGR
jgi:UDPglucose 6-dehydrogenase